MPSFMGNANMPKKSSKKGPRNGGLPQNAYAESLKNEAQAPLEETTPEVVVVSSEPEPVIATVPEPELALEPVVEVKTDPEPAAAPEPVPAPVKKKR